VYGEKIQPAEGNSGILIICVQKEHLGPRDLQNKL
jgi:hypothetical protein